MKPVKQCLVVCIILKMCVEINTPPPPLLLRRSYILPTRVYLPVVTSTRHRTKSGATLLYVYCILSAESTVPAVRLHSGSGVSVNRAMDKKWLGSFGSSQSNRFLRSSPSPSEGNSPDLAGSQRSVRSPGTVFILPITWGFRSLTKWSTKHAAFPALVGRYLIIFERA